MCIQICVTNALTSRAILIGQLYIPFFQNEIVSHLPTYRGFCQRGQLTIDYWWLMYLLSHLTKNLFFKKKEKKMYFTCPLLPIFLKNPYRRPRFLTISIFETRLDIFPWTRTFQRKQYNFHTPLGPF